jgi:effector-binding domain-containing protein
MIDEKKLIEWLEEQKKETDTEAREEAELGSPFGAIVYAGESQAYKKVIDYIKGLSNEHG